MLEHYGVPIQQLTQDHLMAVSGDKRSFYYLPKEHKIMGSDCVIRVGDIGELIRFNLDLPGDCPLHYVTVLAMDDFQLIMASDKKCTRLIFIGPYYKQGIKLLIKQGVSEPILGLVDTINQLAVTKLDIFSNIGYVHTFANKLLQRHATHGDIVKAIYRDGH